MEIPRRGGAEWFGDPLESGSFITSFSDTRPAEIVLQLALAFVAKNGYELTPESASVAPTRRAQARG